MSKQKYDGSFNRNAVQLVDSGQRAAQVARDLGVPANQLYAWCNRYWTTPSALVMRRPIRTKSPGFARNWTFLKCHVYLRTAGDDSKPMVYQFVYLK